MTRFIAVLVLLAALPSVSNAGEAYARLTVSAQVVPRVSLETLDQPSTFTVTSADLERGYVDLSATYRVRNNDPAGFLLRLTPRTALADGVVVSGLASRAIVSDDVVEVAQPASMTPSELAIRIRVRLDPGLAPGEYPLPIGLTATTL